MANESSLGTGLSVLTVGMSYEWALRPVPLASGLKETEPDRAHDDTRKQEADH